MIFYTWYITREENQRFFAIPLYNKKFGSYFYIAIYEDLPNAVNEFKYQQVGSCQDDDFIKIDKFQESKKEMKNYSKLQLFKKIFGGKYEF